MSPPFNPYQQWLGIPAYEQPPTLYRLLELPPFESNPQAIQQATARQIARLHQAAGGQYPDWTQRLLQELTSAQVTLLTPEKKQAYDQWLQASVMSAGLPPAAPQAAAAPQYPPPGAVPVQSPPPAPQPHAYGPTASVPQPMPVAPAMSHVPQVEAASEIQAGMAPQAPAATAEFVSPAEEFPGVRTGRKRSSATGTAGSLQIPMAIAVGGGISVAALVVLAVGAMFFFAGDPAEPDWDYQAAAPPSAQRSSNSAPRRSAAPRGSQPQPSKQQPGKSEPPRPKYREQMTHPQERPPAGMKGAYLPSRPLINDASELPKWVPQENPTAMPDEPGKPQPKGKPRKSSRPPPPAPAARLAVPDAATRHEARLKINEAYNGQIAQANNASKRVKLARQMWDEALKQKEPADKYVLLQRAAEVVAEAGQLELAWEILDDRGSRFVDDVLPEKKSALQEAARFVKEPPHYKAVARAWISLLNEAIDLDRYADAVSYAEEAARAAHKSEDEVFSRRVKQGLKEIRQMQAAYSQVLPAREEVEADMATAASACQWGRFLCAYKNDWKTGLPLWAQGDSPGAELARQEMQLGESGGGMTTAQLRVADGWWKLAEEQEDDVANRLIAGRAAYLYQQAYDLAGENEQARLRQRLTQFTHKHAAVPYGEWIEILGTVNARAHAAKGKWKRVGKHLGPVKADPEQRTLVPIGLTGSYELQLRFKRSEGGEVSLILPVAGQQCVLRLGSGEGEPSGLELISEEPLTANGTASETVIAPGRIHTVDVQVEAQGDQASVTVRLGGKLLCKWQGTPSVLSLPKAYALKQKQAIGLGAHQAQAVFQSLRLRVQDGDVKLY